MTSAELLLLRASLLDGDAALDAWREFRATGADIDHLEGDAFQLLPLLYCNLRQEISDDPACGRLKGIYRRAWYTNQRLLQVGAGVVAQLQAAGIEVMLFDRSALATGIQATGARPMETVDVLLQLHESERALAALTPSGWARSDLHPRTRRRQLGRVVELADENDTTLRLHRSALRPGAYDRTLWNDAVTVSVCGVEALAPGPTDQLLLACTQGLGWTKAPLRWIPDAMLAMRAAAGRCDWAGLAARAGDGEVTLELADAIEILVAWFPEEFAGGHPPEVSRRRASAGEHIRHRIKRTNPRRDPLSRLARRTVWGWEMRRRLAAPAGAGVARRSGNGR